MHNNRFAILSEAEGDSDRRVALLRKIARHVRSALRVDPPRIVGRIRIPDGASEPDELRLAIAPRAAITGFVTIEIGVVQIAGAGGSIALPEVLLRAGGSVPAPADPDPGVITVEATFEEVKFKVPPNIISNPIQT